MPPFELLAPFFIATAIFAVIPGPGMVYMSIQTMARGRRAGWLSAAGFHLGAYLHIVAAAFGITILLQAVPVLFVVLKLLGAFYLIWMGARLVSGVRKTAPTDGPARQRTDWQAFKDSLTVEILNPKTALFWLAFLPQFASPEAPAPVWMQIVVLGTLANLAFSATDAVCIALAARLAKSAAGGMARLGRLGRRIGGGLFIAMGVHLALRHD